MQEIYLAFQSSGVFCNHAAQAMLCRKEEREQVSDADIIQHEQVSYTAKLS